MPRMSDDPEPPRRRYQLKPREFERVNDRPGEPAAGREAPLTVQDHLRAASSGAPPAMSSRPRRRSRRNRDYWLALLGVDALLAFVAFGPFANGATLLFGAAGLILYSVGLTWVMWFVVDDY